MISAPSPTVDFYSALQNAFDHFNTELFAGKLPPCLLTLRSASRVYGYHHAGRFISHQGAQMDELGLHPGFFTLLSAEAALSTLVHEMVHHWQQHCASPSRANAHNQEWARKMESLGLMPSDTGLPGGKKTGRSMDHYIIPGGAYWVSCQNLLHTGFFIPWMDRHLPVTPESQTARTSALKDAGIEYVASAAPIEKLPTEINGKLAVYHPAPKKPPPREPLKCPQCGSKAWVPPHTRIICAGCHVEMLGKPASPAELADAHPAEISLPPRAASAKTYGPRSATNAPPVSTAASYSSDTKHVRKGSC